MDSKVPNKVLLRAALELMRQNGHVLTEEPTAGRSNIYRMADGKTVRVRTSNDPTLVVVAESAEPGARLNIEGPDRLLFVMLKNRRTEGEVVGYLVPMQKAVKDVHEANERWRATDPNTKGNNRTWNLWFDQGGRKTANGYDEKWSEYRLNGTVSTHDVSTTTGPGGSTSAAIDIGQEVTAMQARIARATGLPPQSVKVSIGIVPAPTPSVI